jgi:MOSC domain-containing protein
VSEFIISRLWIYPVKSLGGVTVERAEITPAGSLRGDREWIVVDSHNRMLWQGDIPAMTLVKVELDAEQLTLIAPDKSGFRLGRNHGGAPVEVEMYGHTLAGVDGGDAAATWLSAALGAVCRLVRIGELAHRWSGLNPVHVLSKHSLAVLNQTLLAQGDHELEPERFRPNVLLGGDHEPFAEEAAASIRFAKSELALREPCVRCELPNISRIDASREKQPLKLIGRMSKARTTAKPASFGTYVAARGEALTLGSEGTA